MAPNLDDLDPAYVAEDRGPKANAIMWTAVSVTIVAVSLRCYTRLWLRRIFGFDDVLAIVATVLLTAYTAVLSVNTQYGLGRHTDVIEATHPENIGMIVLLDVSGQPLVLTSCALGKAAFAVTLLRLGGVTTWLRVTLWFIAISINVIHALASFFHFLRCKDPRGIWDMNVETTCWSVNSFIIVNIAIAVYSTLVDFVLAVIPWILIWGLHGMKKSSKIGVAITMSLGVVAGATSIVKLTFLPLYSGPKDFSYTHLELIWWAGCENALIIIAATVPTLRPLVVAVAGAVTTLSRTISKSCNRSKSTSDPAFELQTPSLSRRAPKEKNKGRWNTIDEIVDDGETGVEDEEQQRDGAEVADDNSDQAILDDANHRGGEVSTQSSHSHLAQRSLDEGLGGISVQREFTMEVWHRTDR